MLLNAEPALLVVENYPWQLGRDMRSCEPASSLRRGNKCSTKPREVIRMIPIPKYNALLYFSLSLPKRKNSGSQTNLQSDNGVIN